MSNRSFKRAHSSGMTTNDILTETKKISDCVDTTTNLLKVDIEDITIGTEGLALESKQDSQITLATAMNNGSLRDINNTGAIGDGSSNATAVCLGYDRSNGQGRSLLVDSTGALETNVTVNAGHGLATEAKQDDLINATNRAINNTDSIGDGSTNATAVALGYDRAGGKGRALLVDSDGHLQCDIVSGTVGVGDVRVKGNDGNDGAGTDRIIKTDANGVVLVDGSASTQPVSASSLPLPTGAATAAKQPALGTAGTASADVLSVQGVASMTALVVDGSASTQPISASSLPLPTGAATSALQTSGNTSLATIAGDTTSIDGKITACNTGAVVVSSSALPAGAATEATLSNAEAHLGTIDTSTAGIVASHYADGDAVSGTDTGVLVMGRNGTNTAKPIHITANGDVEVEIADFVKGQATKANSFPVVVASDQDTLAVEQSYSYSSEFTIFPSASIADGANSTSAVFEIQSVKVQDPIITFTVDSGGSTNYDVQAIGSHDGTNFFDIGFAKSFTQSEMSSTSDMGLKVPRYMKFKISNNHGSSTHTFTLKGAGLGLTLATP